MLIVLVDGELTPIHLQWHLGRTELFGEELANNCVRVMESFGLSPLMLRQQLSGFMYCSWCLYPFEYWQTFMSINRFK